MPGFGEVADRGTGQSKTGGVCLFVVRFICFEHIWMGRSGRSWS